MKFHYYHASRVAAQKKRRGQGFTLIELMIVVSVISILAAIAAPKFADMLIKAQEGSTKGNLGALRSALGIYYADNQGVYPSCTAGANSNVFSLTMNPTYIASTPNITTGLHPPVATVYCDQQMVAGIVHDGQGWYFDGTNPPDSQNGTLWVACAHFDTKGSPWTSY